jgi:hypothetical protein
MSWQDPFSGFGLPVIGPDWQTACLRDQHYAQEEADSGPCKRRVIACKKGVPARCKAGRNSNAQCGDQTATSDHLSRRELSIEPAGDRGGEEKGDVLQESGQTGLERRPLLRILEQECDIIKSPLNAVWLAKYAPQAPRKFRVRNSDAGISGWAARPCQIRRPGADDAASPLRWGSSQAFNTNDVHAGPVPAGAAGTPRDVVKTRFGYRRLHLLLKREGVAVDWKKLYRKKRLTVRKRGGRKRALGTRAPMAIP